MTRITDWNSRPLEICRSRGSGVPYVADWQRNVIPSAGPGRPSWLTKQVRACVARRSWFAAEDAIALSALLGRISKFQSLRSEDAITWSWFGTLAVADADARQAVLAWLYDRLELPAQPSSSAAIDQWPRVAHPNALGSPRGPEIDARFTTPGRRSSMSRPNGMPGSAKAWARSLANGTIRSSSDETHCARTRRLRTARAPV